MNERGLAAKAREWGYTDAPNPCQGVKGFPESGRGISGGARQGRRDFAGCDGHCLANRPVAADVLKFQCADIRDGALFVSQNKTGAKRAIEIVGELASVIERINGRKRERQSAFLIQDYNGRPLSMLAMRGRFDKACKAAGVDFQFRDIRAKTASDTGDLGHSQRLLGHRNRDMTEHYVRERIGQRVKPLR